MKPSNIVRLDSYRGRRDARLQRALVLHDRRPWRSLALRRLSDAIALTGGDRAGVFWLDEFGGGLAHPFVVLDLASDQARRSLSAKILVEAWERGVPGMLDLPEASGKWASDLKGARSLCAVSLGSDGLRLWFLVIDSLTPRPALRPDVAGEVMFMAGELSSIVLHGEVEGSREFWDEGWLPPKDPHERPPTPFAGWVVLKDVEGREDDEEANRRITARFLMARFLRALLDDQLVMPEESRTYQIDGIRKELDDGLNDDPEQACWLRVLEGAEAEAYGVVLSAMLEWGPIVEGHGHLHGAQEIHGLAYELAATTGSLESAVDAARFKARVFRMRAEWEQAEVWYESARKLAEGLGDRRKLAVVLDGLANTYRDKGNLPRARELLGRVMELGRDEGDRYASAIACHDLMTVEKLSGNLGDAIQYGWRAVEEYESSDGRLRALFDLAGVLRECGELPAARDAYAIVASRVESFEHRILSLDALAFIAALNGDGQAHRRLRVKMDEEGWDSASAVYRAQMLFYRGLSARALGEEAEARRWLERSLRLAEAHRLSKLIFDAEEALGAECHDVTDPADTRLPLGGAWDSDSILGVRRGLRELRETEVGAL